MVLLTPQKDELSCEFRSYPVNISTWPSETEKDFPDVTCANIFLEFLLESRLLYIAEKNCNDDTSHGEFFKLSENACYRLFSVQRTW